MTVNNGRLLLQVIRDKWTGKTRGYGFVSFANASDLAAALKEMNGISSCPHSLSPFALIIVALQMINTSNIMQVNMLETGQSNYARAHGRTESTTRHYRSRRLVPIVIL